MPHKIAIIRGDGVGPEVIDAAIETLNALNVPLDFVECEVGYRYWKERGKTIPDETWEEIKSSNACLKGPTKTPLDEKTYPSVVVELRRGLGLFANVRPFRSLRGVQSLQPNTDIILVRENTEGLYSGMESKIDDIALTLRLVTKSASLRISRFAFELAKRKKRKKVTVAHKATILRETCGLFREAFFEVAENHPKIRAEEMLIDTAAYTIVTNPARLDVLVTTNLFGDILSDVGAGVVGGLGVCPSANLGHNYGMFEPVHGTAEEIAGKGVANPTATLLAVVMMLEYLQEYNAARQLERALETVLAEREHVTPDLGGKSTTREMVEAIVSKINTF